MNEIQKYETFMRGAFTMLDSIRMQVAKQVSKNGLAYADDLEQQILTPCEDEWKQALGLYREFHKMNTKMNNDEK